MSNPPAGWYDDPELVNTRRYWDGQVWTEHRLEKAAVAPATAGETKPCPYCSSAMSVAATRCPACSGELKYCHKDEAWVGVRAKQINVGLARGSTRMQYRCLRCNKVVEGPRF